MTARILAVVPEGQEPAALPGVATLVGISRAEPSVIRLAYLHRIPPPRLDRHGRVTVDSDGEMSRIEGTALESMRVATRAFGDVSIETVVRFGSVSRELWLETDAFAPTLVALLTSSEGGPLARWRLGSMQRQVWRRPGVRLLVLETPRLPGVVARRPPAMPPWRPDVGVAR